jgi:hypothetical protein
MAGMSTDVADGGALAGVPTERLEADLCALAAHIDAAVCRWLGLVAEFDRREGWAAWECTSCAMWLSWKCGVSLTTAHEHVRVARALTGLPVMRAAFGRGELSYSKVRAMTRVATPAIEADLVEVARESTGAGLERICRAYRRCGQIGDDQAARAYAERSLSWAHDEDGALVLEARLPAEDGELVVQMIEAVRAQLAAAESSAAGELSNPPPESSAGKPSNPPPESSAGKPGPPPTPALVAQRADALVHAARRVLGPIGDTGRAAGAEMTVLVAADQLTDPDTDGNPPGESPCETGHGAGLAPAVARRLACDAVVTPVVVNDKGDPLHLGRRQRIVSPRLRHALHLRDRTCQFPGCDRRSYLRAHHVEHWADGGATDIDNLLLVCSFHHRRLHEGHWHLERGVDGTWHAHRPGGQRFTDPPVTRTHGMRLERLHDELGLHIGPLTNESLWEGPGADVNAVIEYLLNQAQPASGG